MADFNQDFPSRIFSGYSRGGHVQGIAVDEKNGYIYYSFTTVLLKTDFCGNVVGSVKGIVGHLGCISFDSDRKKLYGSLELKHDVIGQIIMNLTGCDIANEDAFYCVCFDCDKIIREDMDAEKDGIMKAVYLPEVVKDYTENDEISALPHRYGCSGIDGIAYGKAFGSDEYKIMLAYGIYGDTSRSDNDYQVILQLDPEIFEKHALPLSQRNPHHTGTNCEKRYFFYSGNTDFGIQNLEYDRFTNSYIAAVYPGTKPAFKNYPMFFIDAAKCAEEKPLIGREGESGLCLSPAQPHPNVKNDFGGLDFPWGYTGVYAFGNGKYAFSHGEVACNEKGEFACDVVLYKYDDNSESVFSEIDR